ncbi:hypothetical protein AC579_2683 [Pseudocercospora musae]|uniref:Uncharacterized protein n=1 Tax=Pseudocercospora musae TaxID=113226 RepID=A0A139IV80_9PEZI|nr:hypothetical protein AC579_2683 [Pseudocercospora musae]
MLCASSSDSLHVERSEGSRIWTAVTLKSSYDTAVQSHLPNMIRLVGIIARLPKRMTYRTQHLRSMHDHSHLGLAHQHGPRLSKETQQDLSAQHRLELEEYKRLLDISKARELAEYKEMPAVIASIENEGRRMRKQPPQPVTAQERFELCFDVKDVLYSMTPTTAFPTASRILSDAVFPQVIGA